MSKGVKVYSQIVIETKPSPTFLGQAGKSTVVTLSAQFSLNVFIQDVTSISMNIATAGADVAEKIQDIFMLQCCSEICLWVSTGGALCYGVTFSEKYSLCYMHGYVLAPTTQLLSQCLLFLALVASQRQRCTRTYSLSPAHQRRRRDWTGLEYR